VGWVRRPPAPGERPLVKVQRPADLPASKSLCQLSKPSTLLAKKSAGAPNAEIEVTPEMNSRRGLGVLWDSGGYAPIDGVDQLLIERIFVAMSRIAVSRSSR
jgi:hypothetical protein